MEGGDWDDLRIFLAVARTGRISAAARRLNCDQSTVTRRIERLEKDMRTTLLFRSTGGADLTLAGARLLEHAERIEAEVLEASGSFEGDAAHPSGVVRMATPEAFGLFLLANNLDWLRKNYPDVRLELVTATAHVSLSKREADIQVSLHRPERGRLVVRKLSDFRLGLYASRSYLELHGWPQSAAELSSHDFVWYVDDLLEPDEFRYLNEVVSKANIVFRSSSIIAQQHAVSQGVGIGLLHKFMARTDSSLVPILPEIGVGRTYWMVMHNNQQVAPRIRAVLNFLDEVMHRNRQLLMEEKPAQGRSPAVVTSIAAARGRSRG